MNIKNILVCVLVGLVFSLFFGFWLAWFINNEQAAQKCGEDLQACRAAYCAKCETDYTCETYCNSLNAE